MANDSNQVFWRDPQLPFVELRKVTDGRSVCYAPHSHLQWSIGAITDGQSTFIYQNHEQSVRQGDLVLINPKWVHACNPVENQPWGYYMVFIDTQWLTDFFHISGFVDKPQWKDLSQSVISDPKIYNEFCNVAECLMDSNLDVFIKRKKLEDFLSTIMQGLNLQMIERSSQIPKKILQVAEYIACRLNEELKLQHLAEMACISQSHFIRTFKQHFGLTPHAYQINLRIQRGQKFLKEGKPIVEAALAAGFTDQPHFQRTFKRLSATTPKHYLGKVVRK